MIRIYVVVLYALIYVFGVNSVASAEGNWPPSPGDGVLQHQVYPVHKVYYSISQDIMHSVDIFGMAIAPMGLAKYAMVCHCIEIQGQSRCNITTIHIIYDPDGDGWIDDGACEWQQDPNNASKKICVDVACDI
jgi:hypothetical protein